MRMAWVVVVTVGSVGCSSAQPEGTGLGTGNFMGKTVTGVATYYDATGAGNCSFDATPNDLDVAAMDNPEYDNSNVCGECVAVTGPKGNVTVRIVDRCPECEAGHLDLSQSAFAKIADVSAGRVPITWHVVECNTTGPLVYHYKDGSSQYWTAIQVRNSRLPIKSLELQTASGFVALNRLDYNFFVDASGAGPKPLTVRVTAYDGQQLTDTLPAPASDTTASGAAQFK